MSGASVSRVQSQTQAQVQPAQKPASAPDSNKTAKPDPAEALSENRAKGEERARLSEEALADTVRKINAVLDALSVQAEFQIYKDIDVIQVKVVDRVSGKLVREVPADDVIERLRKFKELTGLLFDLQV